MRRWILPLMAAVVVSIVSPARAQNMDEIGEGARIWADNCTRCHNARSPMERTDRQWTTIVAHMRARANLTKSEARRVTAYLQMVNGPEVAPLRSAVPEVAGQEAEESSAASDEDEVEEKPKSQSSGSD